MRPLQRSGTLLALALLGSLPPSSAASAPPAVRLSPVGADAVPLGEPFGFRVVVRNPTDRARSVELSIEVEEVGGDEAPVPFDRVTARVGAGSTVRFSSAVTPGQWFDDPGAYRIRVRGPRARPLDFRVTAARVRVPRFRDVTLPAGLATTHRADYVCDNYSAGAAWGDVESDGDLDLYLPHQDGGAQLWVNEGGRFTDRAAAAGVANLGSLGIGAVFADYDNDGDQDLYVVNDGPNRLYRNTGTGGFEDVAAAAGVGDDGSGSSASWADYDNDGRLDLFVTNYGRCETFSPHADRLYHNEGDGTFTDATPLLHRTGSTRGLGFQAAWFDPDLDGDVDLYLGNDYIGPAPEPNALWRNDGPGPDGSWTFTDASDGSRTGLAMNTMGIGVGDYDRDLDLDLALSNMDASVLLRNDGRGRFRDVAEELRVARPSQRAGVVSVTWGMAFADLNDDGWEDLLAVAGSLGSGPSAEPQPDGVFVNDAGGPFLDLSAPSGADDPDVGRGVALADYDRDGRVDLFVVNQGSTPRLLRNVTPLRGTHWLEVDTVGRRSNRDGCGAILVARLDRRTRLLRQVFCGSVGLGSGSDPTAHFGLGSVARVTRLVIRWPSGVRQVLRDVRADRRIVATEPAA